MSSTECGPGGTILYAGGLRSMSVRKLPDHRAGKRDVILMLSRIIIIKE